MQRTAESRSTNRKLSTILKGRNRPLDRIQIPTHDWFHLCKQNKFYRYYRGNFKAYLNPSGSKFYRHHTLQVLPDDAAQAMVAESGDHYELTLKLEWFQSFSLDKLYHRRPGGKIDVYAKSSQDHYTLRKSSPIPTDATAALVTEVERGR